MGEARRLLYVGITRARKELFLSGLATNTAGVQGVRNTAERRHPAISSKDDSTATKGIGCRREAVFLAPGAELSANSKCGLKAPKDSPLAWILTHTTNHDGDMISTFFNAPGSTVAREKVKQVQPLPDPLPFEAQPLPYLIEAPSELVDTSLYAQDAGRGETEPAEHAAIRGTITHRLIEALWHDGEFPETERIATALAAEGMNPDTATAVAQEIADEVTACRKEPFFQWLLDRTSADGKSEYAIEAVKQPGKIQTGILDFVKQDGDRWWIVDFKTSRPVAGQAEAEFVRQEAEHYRPQLTAYQAMLARAKGVDIAQIRAGLYFTSLQQWHEITQDR